MSVKGKKKSKCHPQKEAKTDNWAGFFVVGKAVKATKITVNKIGSDKCNKATKKTKLSSRQK